MYELAETDAAYIAGIIDGEGCINLSHYRAEGVYSPKMAVAITSEPLVDYLVEVAQAHKSKYTRSTAGGRTAYHAIWRANKMRWLLPQIEPYMIIKREQANVILYYLEMFHNARPFLSAEDVAMKENIYQQMRDLKAA